MMLHTPYSVYSVHKSGLVGEPIYRSVMGLSEGGEFSRDILKSKMDYVRKR